MTAPTETPSPAACPGCGGPTTFAETIGTFCGNSGCDRVDDMRPAPSLTTEQARDFAARWAFWDSPDLPPVGGTHPQCLTDGEREQLFAWVRARMKTCCLPGEYLMLVAASGLRGDHEVLAYGVGVLLGGAFEPGTGGWHKAALELCHAEGWPS